MSKIIRNYLKINANYLEKQSLKVPAKFTENLTLNRSDTFVIFLYALMLLCFHAFMRSDNNLQIAAKLPRKTFFLHTKSAQWSSPYLCLGSFWIFGRRSIFFKNNDSILNNDRGNFLLNLFNF